MSRSIYARLHDRFAADRRDGLTRREILLASASAGAGLLLSSQGFAQPSSGRGRVIVVGAGFAGLAAAYELSSTGVDVQVVEARNRIGGRVLSFKDLVPGKVVEGGGELIGSNHALWQSYARRFGLTMLDMADDAGLEGPVTIDGQRLTAAQAEALFEEMDAAFSTMNEDARRIADADKPWLALDAVALDIKTVGNWVSTLSCSDLCRRAIDAMLTADNGVRTEWQSYLGHLAMVKGGGVEAFPRRGRSCASGRHSGTASAAACSLQASIAPTRSPGTWKERCTRVWPPRAGLRRRSESRQRSREAQAGAASRSDSISSRAGTPPIAPGRVQLSPAAALAKRSTFSVCHPCSVP